MVEQVADPSVLSGRDVLREVWIDLKSRPGRTALTALGTLIGVAVLVSTLGLAASLNAQIETRFDALTATEITITSTQGSNESISQIPMDAPSRALRVRGAVSAATLTEVKDVQTITGSPGYDPTHISTDQLAVFATSSGMAEVVHAQLRGTFFSDWHNERGEAVAVLGRGAAQRLGISDVTKSPVVFLDGTPLVVIGIIDDLSRKTILLQAVIVPDGYAINRLRMKGADSLIVESVVGGAAIVGDQLGVALRPDSPESLQVVIPPSPELTRAQVSGDTQNLFIVLGTISLLIGGIGIANVTLVSVIERIPEIGLRRALGARRRHILIQFLLSSMFIGLFGAILGAEVGVLATVLIALAQQWPPAMPIWMPLVSPILGAIIGIIAGLYPSIRASNIEPIAALRT